MAFSCLKVPSVFKFKNLLRHNVFHQQNSLFHPKVLSYWEFDQNNACLNNILQALRIGAFNQDSRGFHYDCENFVDLRFQLQQIPRVWPSQVYVSVPRPRQLTYLLHRSALPTLSPVAALHEYLDTGRPETARSRNLKYMYSYILLVSKHSHTSLIIGPVHRQYLMSAKKSTFLVVFASSCFTVLIIALCCNAQWGYDGESSGRGSIEIN